MSCSRGLDLGCRLARRVDRVEELLSVVSVKIDESMRKLEHLDRIKMDHRERVAKIMFEVESV